jgi:hypothetical protein
VSLFDRENPTHVAQFERSVLVQARLTQIWARHPWFRSNRYDAAREFVQHHRAQQGVDPSAEQIFAAGSIWAAELRFFQGRN